ncbi:unnamed protein product [Chrysodeixis includens]|uniref:Uncharacterized protein n=1 Tax=Chrysodeixis includens TaxID=689277 RepID=A0A9N8PZG8_CHRIL|nr:unnamed protein product [Chrysodeixis includens]
MADISHAVINIKNGKISGLGDFKLRSYNLTKSEMSIDLEINIPHLEFVAEYYDLLGNVYEALPLRGQGELYFEVQNIMLWGKVYLKQSENGESFLVDRIEKPHFSIQRIISRTQFDNNIDGIISSMVEDLLASYLTRFNSYLAESYKENLIQLLNVTCEKYDTWKLITLISNYLRTHSDSQWFVKSSRMKLFLVLMLCGLAAAASTVGKPIPTDIDDETSLESRNLLVNALIRQLIAYVRYVINNGSSVFKIPVLDPLELQHFHLDLPAGLINLDIELKNILATGLGAFVVHRSHLNLHDLSFDLDISVPTIDASAEHYDLTGDFFTAIPLYGKGSATFKVDGFRVQGKLYLKQSDDGKSVLIDRIESASFAVPFFKSNISGAIGGGDIDGIVNSMVEDVIVDYVNRFQGAISDTASRILVDAANPFLDQLDTWRYISVLLPRQGQN